MTAITGRRVDPTVNHVPGKIIPAVGHAAIVFGLMLDGGLQFNSDTMAITAITFPMTGSTYETEPTGHRTMILPKIQAVIKFLIGNLRFLRIMAIRAEAQVLPLFFRVPGRRCITALHGRTSSHQHDQPNTYAYSQKYLIHHKCFHVFNRSDRCRHSSNICIQF